MQQISNTKIISGLLLIACIVQACHTATVSDTAANRQLMCYVCENCAKVTKETPIEACDAAYFDKDDTTETAVTDPTTTAMDTTTESATTEMSSTTTATTTPTAATITSSTTAASTAATSSSTAETTETSSTTEYIPTAPTVGPLPTTTIVPTPPAVGETIAPLATNLRGEDAINASTTATDIAANSTSMAAPEALRLVVDDYTYHCYSVEKKVNGTVSMERGCTRVTTAEEVCKHLQALNNGTMLSKCVPCSTFSCNGSSALGVSVAALMFALIAALLSRQ